MRGNLVDSLKHFGISFDASDTGEWVRFPCSHGGTRYIIRSRLSDGYQSWCDSDHPERGEWYASLDAVLRAAFFMTETRSGTGTRWT